MKLTLTTIILLFFSLNSYAFDSGSSEALKRTQEILKDPKKRMNAINSSEKGKAAHQKLKNLFQTSGNVEKTYDMAAQMMGVITKEAGGDAKKIQDILNKGLTNPASLADRMPSEFKKMLRETAKGVESFSDQKKH